MNALLREAAQRFPLIARPRPACLPLRERVAEVRELADAAAQGAEPGHVTLAAEAMNKAALITSDCGVPEVARSLCWRHFATYLPAWPLDADRARHALEPLVNLARLAIRERDGGRGYRLLDALFQAVSTGGTADIDGHLLPFDGFTRTTDDLRTVRQWLWGVFLAEGIRALISTGQWEQALAHARQHRGLGQRLLDGRQIAIVAHCLAGHTGIAKALLADSTPAQPWEHAVAGCLDVLCSRAARDTSGSTAAEARRRYLELDRAPGLVVFRARLGLNVHDLTADADPSAADRLFASLAGDVLATGDGYAAREVLAHHHAAALLSLAEQDQLASAVRSAGLALGVTPAPLLADLLAAVETSETVIERALNTSTKIASGHAPVPPRREGHT